MKKHDANTKKGKLINFQIALIAIFCFAYTMHEVYTYKPLKNKKSIVKLKDDLVYETIGAVVEVPNVVKPVKSKPVLKPKTKTIEVIEPVKNKTEIEKTVAKETNTEVEHNTTETLTANKSESVITNSTKVEPNTVESKINLPFTPKSVDVLPIFPGCAKYSNNDELAACFQQKVQRMINKKFNKSIGEEIGTKGIQRITLYFEIDKNGEITNVKARSKHKEFIEEAKRVAKLLPKMEPAKSGNKNVKMSYNVPIVFMPSN